MTKKTILVTGATGFVGSRLIPHLKKNLPEYKLVATDLKVPDAKDYLQSDIMEPLDLAGIFKKYENIEFVIHLAAEVSRVNGEEQPNKMVSVNTLGTLNVIRLCLESGAKLINFSTSEIYGDLLLEKDKVSESDVWKLSPFRLTNIYGMSKLFAETLVKHYVANYGLKAVSVRPFMLYGPGHTPNKYRAAIDQFVYGALSGKGFTVHKGGARSWCHVDDFVEAIRLIITKHKFKAGEYQAYDIGVDDYRTMEDLGKMVIEMTGADKKLMKIVTPPKFLSVRKHTTLESIKKLGFKQKTSLEAGLRQLIDWYKKYIETNNSEKNSS